MRFSKVSNNRDKVWSIRETGDRVSNKLFQKGFYATHNMEPDIIAEETNLLHQYALILDGFEKSL